SDWSSTVNFVNENRNLVGAGLSVAEKFARGREVNTLDWTNVAASAISGQQAGGSGFIDGGKIDWDKVARHTLVSTGLSMAVAHRFGHEAGLNYLGSQLGPLVTDLISVQMTMGSQDSQTSQSATAVSETLNNASSPFERRQGLNQAAEDRREVERSEEQALAESQQADESWGMGRPGEQGGAQTFAATPLPAFEATPLTAESQMQPDSLQAAPETEPPATAATPAHTVALGDLAQWSGTAAGDYGLSTSDLAAGPQPLYTMSPEFQMTDTGADARLQANYDFLHSDVPNSRVASLQMMDHGLRNARYQEQMRNIEPIIKPVSEWWSGAKERGSLLVNDPLEAISQGISNTFPFNVQVTQEEVLQALAHKGDGNLDPQAVNELMGSLPLPGGVGITRGIGPNTTTSPIKLSELRALKEMGLSQSGRRAVVEGYDLGLGLTRSDGQWALRDFARNQDARIYFSHGADDINMFNSAIPATDKILASNIEFLMQRSNNIRFNLNGVVNSVDDVPSVVELGSQGIGARIMHRGQEIGNHTNWELYKIMNNDSYLGKTSFYLNGQKVDVSR
ncbi:MAG: hypothetical protein KZQ97_21730, partial [Candidatus Thiodiazotropha sp. (ex Dulcina madagascariensis)]|nr:hypothetical protein [Candidatus Thiodiazotropha sp. (ex Dulcina madagascariensis)]